MNAPRVLGNVRLSCTASYVSDVEASLRDVTEFLAALGNPRRDGFTVSCQVEHPDNLACLFKAEIFTLVDGNYFMEFTRLRGDSLLFAHVLRDYREYVSTGMLPILFPGELIPRCRLGPSNDPQVDVPPLLL